MCLEKTSGWKSYLGSDSASLSAYVAGPPLPKATSSMLWPRRKYRPPEATKPGQGLYALMGHQPKPGTVAMPPWILPSPLQPLSICSLPQALHPLPWTTRALDDQSWSYVKYVMQSPTPFARVLLGLTKAILFDKSQIWFRLLCNCIWTATISQDLSLINLKGSYLNEPSQVLHFQTSGITMDCRPWLLSSGIFFSIELYGTYKRYKCALLIFWEFIIDGAVRTQVWIAYGTDENNELRKSNRPIAHHRCTQRTARKNEVFIRPIHQSMKRTVEMEEDEVGLPERNLVDVFNGGFRLGGRKTVFYHGRWSGSRAEGGTELGRRESNESWRATAERRVIVWQWSRKERRHRHFPSAQLPRSLPLLSENTEGCACGWREGMLTTNSQNFYFKGRWKTRLNRFKDVEIFFKKNEFDRRTGQKIIKLLEPVL